MGIKYTGEILVILDNDVAGNVALKKIGEFHLPQNIRVFSLPKHDSFNKFNTKGTGGDNIENINGRAFFIKCFLDLKVLKEEPFIRWVSQDDGFECYQGRFDKNIKRALKELFDKSFQNNDYDFSKLNFLLDFIVARAKEFYKLALTTIS